MIQVKYIKQVLPEEQAVNFRMCTTQEAWSFGFWGSKTQGLWFGVYGFMFWDKGLRICGPSAAGFKDPGTGLTDWAPKRRTLSPKLQAQVMDHYSYRPNFPTVVSDSSAILGDIPSTWDKDTGSLLKQAFGFNVRASIVYAINPSGPCYCLHCKAF